MNFRKCIFLLSAKFSSYQLAQLYVLLNLGLSLELSVRKFGPEFRFPYKSMFYTCMFYTQLKIWSEPNCVFFLQNQTLNYWALLPHRFYPCISASAFNIQRYVMSPWEKYAQTLNEILMKTHTFVYCFFFPLSENVCVMQICFVNSKIIKAGCFSDYFWMCCKKKNQMLSLAEYTIKSWITKI